MADHPENIENVILNCKIQSDQKWSKIEIDLQKVKDTIAVMEARLNKQAAMVEDIQKLSQSVALLASNMDGMLKEQQRQNERLQTLETKPIKRFDNVLDTVIKIVITAMVGIILAKIGLQ